MSIKVSPVTHTPAILCKVCGDRTFNYVTQICECCFKFSEGLEHITRKQITLVDAIKRLYMMN